MLQYKCNSSYIARQEPVQKGVFKMTNIPVNYQMNLLSDEHFSEGYEEGFDVGYEEGYEEGYQKAVEELEQEL